MYYKIFGAAIHKPQGKVPSCMVVQPLVFRVVSATHGVRVGGVGGAHITACGL